MPLKTIHLTTIPIFVCLMVIGANITVWLPFLAIPIGGTSVPVSLQTFFSILAGFILGKRLGSLAILVYILIGVAGMPVFAGLMGGPFALISPTGGFIISFLLVAWITGKLSETKQAHRGSSIVFISVAGLLVNYLFGVSYMYLALNTWMELPISYLTAWAGMIPFLIKDFVLTLSISPILLILRHRIPALFQLRKPVNQRESVTEH